MKFCVYFLKFLENLKIISNSLDKVILNLINGQEDLSYFTNDEIINGMKNIKKFTKEAEQTMIGKNEIYKG